MSKLSLATFASVAAVMLEGNTGTIVQPGDPVASAVDRMRDRVSREPGGIFGPVNRSREQARRVRQQARLDAKRRGPAEPAPTEATLIEKEATR